MKKKQKQNLVLVSILVAIIASIVGYIYSAEQTKQIGRTFGNELLSIQENLKQYQTEFSSTITQLNEGDMTKYEVIEFSQKHFEKMEELILQYDNLRPPPAFESSVQVFKLSAISQLESDQEYILWIKTQDESHKIRSDALIQESFEYDTAALGKFNRAKQGIITQP